jgi:hypothetical protein
MAEWININGPADHSLWDLKEHCLEFEEVIPSQDFFDDCDQYLPDIFAQAAKDIPRMRVCINGQQRINNIHELVEVVALTDLSTTLLLCTQTIWGHAYESVCMGSNLIVCELHAPAAAVVNLISSQQSKPYSIRRMEASKQMRAAEDVDTLVQGHVSSVDLKLCIEYKGCTIISTRWSQDLK